MLQAQSQKADLKFTVAALLLFGDASGFGSGFNGLVLKPGVGYFINNSTSVDINFSYAPLNDLRISGVDSYYNSYAFVPTLRNNFVNRQKWRAFAEVGFGLGTIKYKAENQALTTFRHDELSGGISILTLGAGVNYFVNDNFDLELITPYISTRNITSDTVNNLYSGLEPTLGVTYVID